MTLGPSAAIANGLEVKPLDTNEVIQADNEKNLIMFVNDGLPVIMEEQIKAQEDPNYILDINKVDKALGLFNEANRQLAEDVKEMVLDGKHTPEQVKAYINHALVFDPRDYDDLYEIGVRQHTAAVMTARVLATAGGSALFNPIVGVVAGDAAGQGVARYLAERDAEKSGELGYSTTPVGEYHEKVNKVREQYLKDPDAATTSAFDAFAEGVLLTSSLFGGNSEISNAPTDYELLTGDFVEPVSKSEHAVARTAGELGGVLVQLVSISALTGGVGSVAEMLSKTAPVAKSLKALSVAAGKIKSGTSLAKAPSVVTVASKAGKTILPIMKSKMAADIGVAGMVSAYNHNRGDIGTDVPSAMTAAAFVGAEDYASMALIYNTLLPALYTKVLARGASRKLVNYISGTGTRQSMDLLLSGKSAGAIVAKGTAGAIAGGVDAAGRELVNSMVYDRDVNPDLGVDIASSAALVSLFTIFGGSNTEIRTQLVNDVRKSMKSVLNGHSIMEYGDIAVKGTPANLAKRAASEHGAAVQLFELVRARREAEYAAALAGATDDALKKNITNAFRWGNIEALRRETARQYSRILSIKEKDYPKLAKQGRLYLAMSEYRSYMDVIRKLDDDVKTAKTFGLIDDTPILENGDTSYVEVFTIGGDREKSASDYLVGRHPVAKAAYQNASLSMMDAKELRGEVVDRVKQMDKVLSAVIDGDDKSFIEAVEGYLEAK